ncbi:MAG: MASE1 domain-containing protein [Burkholderiales bacterium]|nr:MASE1 domain-containing protein [Burkholderiales bacterium]
MNSPPSAQQAREGPATRRSPLGRDLLGAAGLALAYVLAARVGFHVAPLHAGVPALWLASGVALAVLALRGPRLAPAVLVGGAAAGAWSGLPLAAAVGAGAGAALAALAGALLLAHAHDFQPTLRRGRDVFLMLAAAASAASVSATVGTASLWFSGAEPAVASIGAWLAWWGGDALGVLILAPAVFAWTAQPRPDRVAAGAIAYGMLIGAGLLVASNALGEAFAVRTALPVAAFALAPVAVLPAIRFPLREVASFNLTVAAVCVVGVAGGLASDASGPNRLRACDASRDARDARRADAHALCDRRRRP